MSSRVAVTTQVKTSAAPGPVLAGQSPFVMPEYEAERADVATQLEGAARLGHSLGAIGVDGSAPSTIQRQEMPEEEEEKLQMQREPAGIQRQELPEEEEEGEPATVQRQELPDEEEQELQMKPDPSRGGLEGGPIAPDVEAAMQRARGDGQPSDDTSWAQMGETLGHDFSAVRVHRDPEAPGQGRGPTGHEVSHVVQLPSTLGNRAVSPVPAGSRGGIGAIQAKLTVGPAGDRYEQEADRVAEQVLAMPAPREPQAVQRHAEQRDEEEVQAKPLAAGITPLVQRAAQEEEAQTRPLVGSAPSRVRRRGDGGLEAGSEIESRLAAQKGAGQPLPGSVRDFMEPRFGADFSGVRLHSGGEAAQMNADLRAQAFTHGQDIYLGAGAEAPGSKAGNLLLAHELAHTIQQTGNVQRLPTRADVTIAAGPPKTKGSELYKRFLDALDSYESEVVNQVDLANIGGQVTSLCSALWQVIYAAAEYNSVHHTDERARYVAAISEQARLEIRAVRTRGRYYQSNPAAIPAAGLPWRDALPKDMGTMTIDLSKATQVGQAAGALNIAGQQQFPGGHIGLPAGYTGWSKAEKGALNKQDADWGIAKDLGIPVNEPKFGNRSLAMYRIDQLLGANMLTRANRVVSIVETRRGIKKTREVTTVGLITEEALGEKFGEKAIAGGVHKTAAQAQASGVADAISMDDPKLQRGLSKLNLLDALCYQVDRHMGNYYVRTDGQGQVQGVTGIDNDLAFPAATKFHDIGKMYREYPGVSYYADKEMAEMILALDEGDLKAAVAGLLSNEEIDGLVARLNGLKARLTTAKAANRLLDPAQWDAVTAAKEEAEGTGYIYETRRKLP